jgi:hypothetical protein
LFVFALLFVLLFVLELLFVLFDVCCCV